MMLLRSPKTILFLAVAVLLTSLPAEAQTGSGNRGRRKKPKVEEVSPYDVDTLKAPILRQRVFAHDRVDKEQKRADLFDGATDSLIAYGDDTLATRLLTTSLLRDVNQMQVMIENMVVPGDAQIQNQTKIRYLTYLWNMVRRFNTDTRPDPYAWRRQVANMKVLLIARHEGKLNQAVLDNINPSTLANAEVLEGFPAERAVLYSGMGKQEPEMMIRRLGEFANEPFACDIIAEAARVVPGEVRNYATSTNTRLSGAVKRCDDALVKTIVRISTESKSSLKAMPFLADIHSGRRTVAEVDKITGDADLFYKALIDLKLRGESVGGDTYSDEIAYRGRRYIREMNDLHEESDAVRFRIIEKMTPEELYFLVVYDDDNELYTSSYIGVFKRMMERLKGRPGDSLLTTVRYDRFRTFIRKCANYNTLTPFLATIGEAEKTKLMRDFVANLEIGRENDLDAAVDVADAFGSIEDATLAEFLRGEVRSNYERTKGLDNKKGIIVYGLLATLFNQFSAGAVEGETVGLPPINLVPYNALVDDSGVVYEQVFFYGDEDGKMSYASFTGAIAKEGGWKTETGKQWAKFTSTTGAKPMVIYANLPLMDKEGADEEAQTALEAHLAEQGIKPTVIIHRGHSYHLPTTLEHLQKHSRVVMLGSCGGYHNLGTVLDKSPDAQIISTKQTGTAFVNEEIIRALNKRLRAGEDIEWVSCWKDLATFFAGKGEPGAKFKDYVPPHRNLGAIFIKAYRRMAATDEA